MSKARWLMLPALLATSVASAAPVTAQQIRDLLPLTGFERMGEDAAKSILANEAFFPQVTPQQRQCMAAPIGAVLNDALVEWLVSNLGDEGQVHLKRWQAFYTSQGGKRMVATQRQMMYGTALPAEFAGEPSELERKQVGEFMASGSYEALAAVLAEMGDMPDGLPARMSERILGECGVTIDSNEFS
ncbi:hypothetical protein [Stenotrophomonas sp.]|uniref:hypothetical protein n=1 Tax=Stenotrophomonas sp. TaxID=69392 RepID=UPI0028ADF594|nr:hypothetical protein [Stenotrophomonas sp.]